MSRRCSRTPASSNFNYQQAFSTGTSFTRSRQQSADHQQHLQQSDSARLEFYYRFTVQQQLLAGFGTGPNLRFLRIAKNNKKISDIAFKTRSSPPSRRSPTSIGTWSAPTKAENGQRAVVRLRAAKPVNAQKQLQLEAIPADGRDARRGRSIAPRPGPDDRENQSSVAGIADQECAHQEPRRSRTRGDAGHSHGSAGRGRC